MSAKGAAHLMSRCAKCRINTVTAFIGFASCPRPTGRHLLRHQIPLRGFAEALPRATHGTQETQDTAETREASEPAAQELPSTTSDPEASTSQPWYLQDPVHQAPANPLLERQRLPDLPPEPPEPLQSILEHLSIDIGLDYLRLLDLRHLRPPPALGANLLMIIGTARSEKHLHVSADRFCRWLRSEHRLGPSADGLLGRNELKIRLRRKNKRAKERARRGLGAEANVDDGIRTGWICVNVGLLEEGPEIEVPLEGEGVVGFGTQQRGSTLVVQMVTEEKRQELDLEALWQGALRRQKRREERGLGSESTQEAEEDSSDANETLEDASGSPQRALASSQSEPLREPEPDSQTLSQSATPSRPLLGSLKSGTGIVEQKRALHSTTRNLDRASQETQPTKSGDAASGSGDAASEVTSSFASPSVATGLQEMEDLLRNFRQLSTPDALEALGDGAKDHCSSEFLRLFYDGVPLVPSIQHWIMRFRLISYALFFGHKGYRECHLVELLEEMQCADVDIPQTLLENIITIVADPLSFNRTEEGEAVTAYVQNLHGMLHVLQTMSLRGLDPLSETVIEGLYRMINQTRLLSVAHGLHETAAANLSRVLARAERGLQRVDQHVAVLRGIAAAKAWPDYWRYWRSFPTRLERRPATMYAALFQHAARTRHADFCRDVLDDWVPEMGLELPRVALVAEVARAVMECIEVAAPQYTKLDGTQTTGQELWAELWNKCVEGKDQPGEKSPKDGKVHVVDLKELEAYTLTGSPPTMPPEETTDVQQAIEQPNTSEQQMRSRKTPPGYAGMQDDSASFHEQQSSALLLTP